MDHSSEEGNRSMEPAIYHRPSPFRIWWREFLASFVVLGIIGAIVGILVPFQDRPLPEWPHHITINALVAILIVIAKFLIAFVLAECLGQLKWNWFEESRPLSDLVYFERASRGSLWGSLRLLWTLRGRSLLACIGAVVTVLSIAIDPFTQQLIQYYPCARDSASMHGSISVARMWHDADAFSARNSPGLTTAGYGTQGAIMNGLFSPGSQSVPFDCGTGNCSFTDPIYTLGYCSSCEDATKDITFNQRAQIPITQTIPFRTTVATATQTGIIVETASSQGSVFRLPSNLTAMPGSVQSRLIPVSNNGSQGTWEMNFEMLFANPTGVNASIANNSDTLWSKRGLGAARCNLKPCIYELQSDVTAGVLTEKTLSTATDLSWATRDASTIVITQTSCLSSSTRSALASKLNQNNLPDWLAYDPVSKHDDSIPQECTFVLDASSTTGITSFLSTYLTQTAFDFGHLGGSAPPQLNVLYRQGNTSFSLISSTFNNLTTSLSHFFRQSPYANTTSGIVHEQTTCVNIVWKWFSFFGAITGLSYVVLLSTIIRDWRTGHDFKTGILPMLFGARGMVDPETAARKSGLASDMEHSVQTKRVRFSLGEDGWRFTETEGERRGVEQQTVLVGGKE